MSTTLLGPILVVIMHGGGTGSWQVDILGETIHQFCTKCLKALLGVRNLSYESLDFLYDVAQSNTDSKPSKNLGVTRLNVWRKFFVRNQF